MTDDDPQTVTVDPVPADAPSKETEAEPEATGAQDTADTDWVALVADSQTEPEKAKPEPEASDLKDRIKILEEQQIIHQTELVSRDTSEGLTDAVQTIKTDNEGLKNVPDRLVEGFIYALNVKHPQLEVAFKARHKDPQAWSKAKEMIGKELTKDFADMPDANLTEGVEAARQAVRGVSNQPPAKQEISDKVVNAMNDSEFAAFKKEQPAQA